MNFTALTNADAFVLTIGVVAILVYFGAIFYAGYEGIRGSGQQPVVVPEFISLTITTVSGTLATFLGMALGFKQASGAAKQASSEFAKLLELSWPQTIAAWVYILSLLLALGFWASSRFSNTTAPIIQNLAKSILGLFGGALAVVLNVK
jgi:hypothetical protein